MICLDTNVVIGATSGRSPHIAARFDAELTKRTSILLPAIVLFELRYGVAKSSRPERGAETIERFLETGVEIVPFEAEDASEAGVIRAALESVGTPIGHYDVLIAAQARRRGAVLVTANRREFDRVPGLTVEDWTV